jgi:hypothetical protein
MTDQLTPTQTLLVWCLLAKQGVAKQADIMPAVKAADRKVLEALKFVTVATRSRSLWITLADKGWSWADDHLRDPVPPPYRVLQDLMGCVHAHLSKADEKLSDFIGPPEKDVSSPVPTPMITLKAIKTAYAKVSNKKTAVRVLLSDLRDYLPKDRRADIDQALCRSHLSGKITLMRLDNPTDITPAIKDAGIDFKGEPLHIIWIEK